MDEPHIVAEDNISYVSVATLGVPADLTFPRTSSNR